MAASNSSRGAHYKARSKKWAAKHGYPIADMELVRLVHTREGVFPTKRDQWGSDLQYLDPDGVVFLQVKGGGKSTTELTRQAQAAFDEHRFPASCRLELHIWRPRARVPEIIACLKTNLLT